MKSNAYKPGLRVELKDNFRKEVFRKLLDKHSYDESAKMLDVTHGLLYHYKNKRVRTIPFAILEKIIELIDIPKEQLLLNVKDEISSTELRQRGLKLGQAIRHSQLRIWRKELPAVSRITQHNYLDVEKWFNGYHKLLETGGRRFESIKIQNNKIILSYNNYVKGKLKRFCKTLPRKILIDRNFQYFFGLWCGDRAGGGRIGIVNKSTQLLYFTEYFLKKLYQEVKYEILKSDNIDTLPKFQFKVDKINEIKNMNGTYAVVCHSVNGILKRFFDYLEKDLDEVLCHFPNKNIFFAGLFDAEGNVFFEDGAFRWACKHPARTKIYTKHLKSLNLFDRYDGHSLITQNREVFKALILPHMKQQDKVNKARILCNLNGVLDTRFKQIISLIAKNPNLTNNELAKLLKLKKAYAQVNFLEKFGYVSRYEYPKRIKVTEKGLKEVM
jgi:hypothetical protein